MKKYSFILIFLSVYAANCCYAQPSGRAFTPGKTASADKPNKSKDNGTSSTKANTLKSTLTIITDEECTIKLDKKYTIKTKKGATPPVTVSYGSYKLTAINPTTGDEYNTDLIVKSASGTVRIDWKEVRNERQRKIDSALRAKKIVDIVQNSGTGISANGTGNTNITDANTNKKAVVTLLLSNMIKIPSGEFTMGRNLGDNDEEPEHLVTIREIQFAKYEITQQQWETITGTNPSINQGCKDCPVENVSWNEVDSFLVKINQLSSKTFRLPTEAEWEYVASKGGAFQDMKEKAWYNANAEKHTHPVGLKSPNAFGVFDLSGNVAEWCSDWYGFRYYSSNPRDNPAGPKSGKDKVVRGGSFDNSAGSLRFSYRSKQNPAFKNGQIGLRLVTEK